MTVHSAEPRTHLLRLTTPRSWRGRLSVLCCTRTPAWHRCPRPWSLTWCPRAACPSSSWRPSCRALCWSVRSVHGAASNRCTVSAPCGSAQLWWRCGPLPAAHPAAGSHLGPAAPRSQASCPRPNLPQGLRQNQDGSFSGERVAELASQFNKVGAHALLLFNLRLSGLGVGGGLRACVVLVCRRGRFGKCKRCCSAGGLCVLACVGYGGWRLPAAASVRGAVCWWGRNQHACKLGGPALRPDLRHAPAPATLQVKLADEADFEAEGNQADQGATVEAAATSMQKVSRANCGWVCEALHICSTGAGKHLTGQGASRACASSNSGVVRSSNQQAVFPPVSRACASSTLRSRPARARRCGLRWRSTRHSWSA